MLAVAPAVLGLGALLTTLLTLAGVGTTVYKGRKEMKKFNLQTELEKYGIDMGRVAQEREANQKRQMLAQNLKLLQEENNREREWEVTKRTTELKRAGQDQRMALLMSLVGGAGQEMQGSVQGMQDVAAPMSIYLSRR